MKIILGKNNRTKTANKKMQRESLQKYLWQTKRKGKITCKKLSQNFL